MTHRPDDAAPLGEEFRGFFRSYDDEPDPGVEDTVVRPRRAIPVVNPDNFEDSIFRPASAQPDGPRHAARTPAAQTEATVARVSRGSSVASAEPRTQTISPEQERLAQREATETAEKAEREEVERGRLRRSLLLTVASTLLPGVGMVGSRSKLARAVGVLVPLALVGGAAWLVLGHDRGTLASLAFRPDVLTAATWGLIGLAIGWVTLICCTHLLTRPSSLGFARRTVGATAVTICSLLVAAPLAVASRYAYDHAKFIGRTFGENVEAGKRPKVEGDDPWKDIPRLNILLLGSDGNAARREQSPDLYDVANVRTDTMMVASIETATGNTTLVQIPRNVRFFPFPAGSQMQELYPDGFRAQTGDPADDWLTELWSKADNEDYPDIKPIFAGNTYPGAELLQEAVEGITGLPIDYFVLLNIDGLQRLIDEMGGVVVNINEPLPKGRAENCRNPERCLQPGPNQRLGGYDAMWYARSRKGSDDYSRMARQSCLVDAIIKQANPATLVQSYEGIAGALADMLYTDIPSSAIPAIVKLAVTVQSDGKVNRLVFVNGKNYNYDKPDFDDMRQQVADIVDPKATPTTQASPPATNDAQPPTTQDQAPTTPAAPPPSAPPASSAPATPKPSTQTVTDACAYNPVTPGADEEED